MFTLGRYAANNRRIKVNKILRNLIHMLRENSAVYQFILCKQYPSVVVLLQITHVSAATSANIEEKNFFKV